MAKEKLNWLKPHLCPICGIHAFPEKDSFDICPVCGWEDNCLGTEYPNRRMSANHLRMDEAKRVYTALCKLYPRKKPVLTASHRNWGLMTEYCRASNDFSVYTDGQYFVKWRFNKSGEEKPDEALSAAGDGAEFCERSKTYRCSGKMSAQAFQRLMEAVNTDPWRRKGEQIFACDGDAWKFRQFDANGNTVRDSGALGYIYGNAVLERIASLLWELALHDAE